MKLQTIAEQWRDYWAEITKGMQHISDVQKTETRRGFYAGMFAAICTMRECGTDNVSEDDAVAHLESMHRECMAFYGLVKEGKA